MDINLRGKGSPQTAAINKELLQKHSKYTDLNVCCLTFVLTKESLKQKSDTHTRHPYTCMHTRTRACTLLTHMHTHMHAHYSHTCTLTHMHAHTHTCMHTRTRACTHTCMLTHMLKYCGNIQGTLLTSQLLKKYLAFLPAMGNYSSAYSGGYCFRELGQCC